VDECQNCSWEELNTCMTRVGYMSKIMFCGDYRQNDLNKKKNDMSGLSKFLDIADLMESHTRIEFTVDDIVRSSIVRDWVIASLKYEDNNC
jgi:phosphate starvation-inducible PhoH-like protein